MGIIKRDLFEEARAFHAFRAERTGDKGAILDSVLNDMHTLDAKSTGLLTFISLALAALTFALNLVDRRMDYELFIKAGLIFFIGVFSVAAWFSLRCLDMSGPPFTRPPSDALAHEREAIAEVAVRRYDYFISLRITRGALALLVPFVILWIGLLAREMY